jgi:hypothetical protein
MSSQTLRLVAAAVLALTMAAWPAGAQTPPQAQTSPETLAREAIDKLMQALAVAIQNLPQYEMPRLNERGDIIIRRINPPSGKPADKPLPDDETRT